MHVTMFINLMRVRYWAFIRLNQFIHADGRSFLSVFLSPADFYRLRAKGLRTEIISIRFQVHLVSWERLLNSLDIVWSPNHTASTWWVCLMPPSKTDVRTKGSVDSDKNLFVFVVCRFGTFEVRYFHEDNYLMNVFHTRVR